MSGGVLRLGPRARFAPACRLKRDIIRTRMVPVAPYSSELWQPRTGRHGTAACINSALHKARRLAVGVHATAGEQSWECGAGVSAAVLQADFQVLDVQGYCDATHLRYAEAARVADVVRPDNGRTTLVRLNSSAICPRGRLRIPWVRRFALACLQRSHGGIGCSGYVM